MPTAMRPRPVKESSHERSPSSARSYEGIEHPAKPSAAIRADRVDWSWVHCPDPCHSDLVGQHLVQALPLPEEAERPTASPAAPARSMVRSPHSPEFASDLGLLGGAP